MNGKVTFLKASLAVSKDSGMFLRLCVVGVASNRETFSRQTNDTAEGRLVVASQRQLRRRAVWGLGGIKYRSDNSLFNAADSRGLTPIYERSIPFT